MKSTYKVLKPINEYPINFEEALTKYNDREILPYEPGHDPEIDGRNRAGKKDGYSKKTAKKVYAQPQPALIVLHAVKLPKNKIMLADGHSRMEGAFQAFNENKIPSDVLKENIRVRIFPKKDFHLLYDKIDDHDAQRKSDKILNPDSAWYKTLFWCLNSDAFNGNIRERLAQEHLSYLHYAIKNDLDTTFIGIHYVNNDKYKATLGKPHIDLAIDKQKENKLKDAFDYAADVFNEMEKQRIKFGWPTQTAKLCAYIMTEIYNGVKPKRKKSAIAKSIKKEEDAESVRVALKGINRKQKSKEEERIERLREWLFNIK